MAIRNGGAAAEASGGGVRQPGGLTGRGDTDDDGSGSADVRAVGVRQPWLPRS
jgi:hypothetical protein